MLRGGKIEKYYELEIIKKMKYVPTFSHVWFLENTIERQKFVKKNNFLILNYDIKNRKKKSNIIKINKKIIYF